MYGIPVLQFREFTHALLFGDETVAARGKANP